MQYVIVGNSAAAIGAVESIRNYDTENPILVISDEPYHTYSRPLISYYLTGLRDEESIMYRPKNFYDRYKVETMLGRRVEAVVTEKKQLKLDNQEIISYNKLLIATGGKPFLPPIEGATGPDIYNFIKLDDAKDLKEVAQPGKSAVVIGGGLIGLKVAEGLLKNEVAVTVVDLAPQLLNSILDAAGAGIVKKCLEKKGMEFHLGTTAKTIQNFGERKIVGLADGKEVVADFVVVAVGVVPNKHLVEDTDIKVNRGIVTDHAMGTSVEGIFAAGDVAENYDVLFGQNRVIPILPNAYEQGQVAGANMAGQKSVYPGGFAKNAIGFFGLSMVTAGITTAPDETFQEYSSQPTEDRYLKVVIKEGKLVGFVRINAVDRSGILTGLLMQQKDVTDLIPQLISEEIGLIDLPQDLRKARLKGDAVQ